MAEGVGFEPTLGFPLSLISSQVPSTTQPPFPGSYYARIRVRGKLIWQSLKTNETKPNGKKSEQGAFMVLPQGQPVPSAMEPQRHHIMASAILPKRWVVVSSKWLAAQAGQGDYFPCSSFPFGKLKATLV